jgi:hypothetical protein
MSDAEEIRQILLGVEASARHALRALDLLARHLGRQRLSNAAFQDLVVKLEHAAAMPRRRALLHAGAKAAAARRMRPGPRHPAVAIAIPLIRFERLQTAGVPAELALERARATDWNALDADERREALSLARGLMAEPAQRGRPTKLEPELVLHAIAMLEDRFKADSGYSTAKETAPHPGQRSGPWVRAVEALLAHLGHPASPETVKAVILARRRMRRRPAD